MKKSKKHLFIGATLILASLMNFIPSNAKNASRLVEDEYKSFENCWGSGNYSLSCTNGSATVYGCQPETGSYCAGKLREGEEQCH